MVSWLLDAEVFDYHEELAAEIVRQGFQCRSINAPNPPYRWEDVDNAYRRLFPPGACVVTHADIELVTRVQREALWTPGAFATIAHFYCSYYYPHLRRFLLNEDHAFLPFAELCSREEELFERFGRAGRIFVRPDSPLKLFTGMVAARETFPRDVEFMGFYEFPADSPVVVSSPKSIEREWRFVIADGRVVTGCEYKEGEVFSARPAVAGPAVALAEAVLQTGFEPDPVWVLDVCATAEGDFRLMEIGGFSFANLYACDKRAVVSAVSAVAARVHAGRVQ